MAKRSPITTARLIELYERHKSIQKVADQVGRNRATVHARLVKAGVVCDGGGKRWTQDDDHRLLAEYPIYRNAGRLGDLAALMGRTKPFICRQAKILGLTDQSGPKLWAGTWKYMTADAARFLMDEFKQSPRNMREFCQSRNIGQVGFWQAMSRHFPGEWEAVIESKQKAPKYRRGRAFEYRVRDDFKRLGYVCLRSPRSAGPFDLIAIGHGQALFIQCKVGGQLGPKEWNALVEIARSVQAVPILASRVGFRDMEYWELMDTKVDGRRGQPRQPFYPDARC